MEYVLLIDILYSITLYAINDIHQAKRVMEQTLAFAEAEGYIRCFVDYIPFVSPILMETGIASNAQGSTHLMTVMKACNIDTYSATISEQHKILTKRELEVLKLLADGYKYREIADKIFVSHDTVKTHTKHIYEKLGVGNRTQAIRRANYLKLYENN
jgi:LuxR family maltose regulon positive regulatory protein